MEEEEENQERVRRGWIRAIWTVGGSFKTATEEWEGNKRRDRHLQLQRDHRQRRWSLKRGFAPKHSKGHKSMQAAHTASGVICRSGGLAEWEPQSEKIAWAWLDSEEEEGSGLGWLQRRVWGDVEIASARVTGEDAPRTHSSCSTGGTFFPWHLICKWKTYGLPSKLWKQMQNRSVNRQGTKSKHWSKALVRRGKNTEGCKSSRALTKDRSCLHSNHVVTYYFLYFLTHISSIKLHLAFLCSVFWIYSNLPKYFHLIFLKKSTTPNNGETEQTTG